MLSFLNEQTWRLLIDALPGRVFWKDTDSRYMGCNRAFAIAAKLEGPEDIVGKTDYDLIKKDIAESLIREDQSVMQTKQAMHGIEERLQSRNGSVTWWESNKLPLIDADGSVVGVLGVYQDVTERKRMQQDIVDAEQAKTANRMKSEFLTNMSHEIRTPLNGILGMAQVLSDRLDEPELLACTDTIIESGELLLSVVNDVLDISKIEAGKINIIKSPTHLDQCLNSLIELWRPTAQEKNLTLKLSLDPKLPEVLEFDSTRLKQCISNLISNALKFTERGYVSVRVSGSTENNIDWRLLVHVEDTGIGIARDVVKRLFNEFEQASDTTARDYGGTGLGLAISRRFANLMGGDLNVKSRLGVGSTFILHIEAQTPASEHKVSPSQKASRPGHLNLVKESTRALLIDDNLVNLKVARAFIGKFIGDIVEVDSGESALKLLERDANFDVIYLDKRMPGMDGLETLKHIRNMSASYGDVPIIALTADAMAGEREALLEAGFDGYATKPINREHLLAETLRVLSAVRQ